MNRARSLLTLVIALSSLFVVGLAANQQVQVAPVGPLTRASAAFAHFYLFRATASPRPSLPTHTLVDTSGGVHSAFDTTQFIHYAYCPADCDNVANWRQTSIAEAGYLADSPTLALDPNNHPRMMWYQHDADPSTNNYFYAECNADCTNAANWTVVQVPRPLGYYIFPGSARYFVLDSQGRPRFVCQAAYYEDENNSTGITYATCDGNCTTASNWHLNLIDLDRFISDPQIVLTTNDQPRITSVDTEVGIDDVYHLMYLGCDANCTQAGSWQHAMLYELGEFDHFSFRLDSHNWPRVAFYSQASSDTAMYYAWNNSTSITTTGWLSDSLTLPPNDGRTIDLALDSQNRPRMALGAYHNDMSSLGYAECTANCESTNSTWWYQDIETRDELDISDPIPPGACITPNWEVGEFPSLALDSVDQPNISYYAEHTKLCWNGSQYDFISDAWAIRFAHPGGSFNYWVYLPAIRKP